MAVRTYVKVLTSCFLALMFFVAPAFAVIEPPYKEIEYCYRIDNISAFPDFVVFARIPAALGGEIADPVQLKEGECYVRNTRDEIVAVRKEYTLNSGIRTPVSPVKIYDPQDARKKIEDIFTIDALDDQTFSLRLAKKIVERDDGTSEEKVYATAEEGLADPPGPGYEYTDDFENEEAYGDPEEENEVKVVWRWEWMNILWNWNGWRGMNIILPILPFLPFALYAYVAAALFTIARRFNIRHRWRAWIPIANIHLLVETTGRPMRWFWIMIGILIGGLIVIPNGFLLSALVGGALTTQSTPSNNELAGITHYVMPLFVFGVIIPITVCLSELFFFVRILSSLAVRCDRPRWWGPLMVLVPPVGLVLLGVMAWSKNSQQSLPVNT